MVWPAIFAVICVALRATICFVALGPALDYFNGWSGDYKKFPGMHSPSFGWQHAIQRKGTLFHLGEFYEKYWK